MSPPARHQAMPVRRQLLLGQRGSADSAGNTVRMRRSAAFGAGFVGRARAHNHAVA